jgi:G:T-mismatch repair DNA endonuclease (very short patch repair protein)
MNKNKCLICGKETDCNKYCSRNCYYESKRGIKRPDFGKKISEIMIKKNESYKNTVRSKNISKARQFPSLTEEEWKYIKEKKTQYFYVTNFTIFLSHCDINRPLNKSQKLEIRDFLNKDKSRYPKVCPLKIQKWDISKMDSFLKDLKNLTSRKIILEKYSLSLKELFNFVKRYNLDNIYNINEHKKRTLPEQFIFSFLTEEDIIFRNEKYINNMKWRVDFLLKRDIIIEVQGDYWHGNPRIYNESILNKVQKINIDNDKHKAEWILAKGYTLFHIWEMDIYNNFEKIKGIIQKIVKGEFNEKYYNSQFI